MCRLQLTAVSDRQLRFLQVLPTLPDLQVVCLLLLYCASPRSNYARTLPANLTARFASASDQAACILYLMLDHCGHLRPASGLLSPDSFETRWLGTAEYPTARAWAVPRRDPELVPVLPLSRSRPRSRTWFRVVLRRPRGQRCSRRMAAPRGCAPRRLSPCQPFAAAGLTSGPARVGVGSQA